jgi:ubiquinone/menaquinone biosynthesis C-methylase UbiE
MMHESTYPFPPVNQHQPAPVWNQSQFRIAEQSTRILDYLSHEEELGWNDGLTAFHELEAGDNHFIDQASRQQALSQLKRHVKNPHAVILEVGCSSGFMLQSIKNTFKQAFVLGADITKSPLESLGQKLPDLPLLRFDLTKCPLPDESVDAVVLLNVLEHIEADHLAMSQVRRILKPGGVAIIEVPAGPNLFDIYDKMLLHYRRYKLSALKKMMEKQEFLVKKSSHLGCFLYPGFRMVKKRNRRLFAHASLDTIKQQVSQNIRSTRHHSLMNALLKCEMLLGKWVSWPMGIRCLMTCIRK